MLKDTASYKPWEAKLTSILDAEDGWEIVNGTEVEPNHIRPVTDSDDAEKKRCKMAVKLAEQNIFKNDIKKRLHHSLRKRLMTVSSRA